MKTAKARVWRLSAPIGLTLAFVLLAGVAGLFQREMRQQDRTVDLVHHTRQVVEELLTIGVSYGLGESALNEYAAALDRGSLDQVETAFVAAVAGAARVRELTRDNAEQQRRLDELEPMVRRRLSLLRARVDALRAGARLPIPAEALSLSLGIPATLQRMVDAERVLLAGRIAARDQDVARTRWIFIVSLGATFALLVGVMARLMRETRERGRAEAELGAKHALLESIMEETTDAVYVKDLQGRYRLINGAGAALLGRSVADVLGKRDRDLVSVEEAEASVRADREILVSGRSITYEETINVGGTPTILQITKGPHRTPDRQTVGVVGVARDITERRRADDARLSELSLLFTMAEMLQACRSVEEAYDVIDQLAPRLFTDNAGAMYLFHASRDHLEPHAAWGALSDQQRLLPFLPDECVALRRGQPHVLDTGDSGMRCRHLSELTSGSALCVPLLANGEVLGVLHLRHPQSIGEPLRQRAGVVAEQISMALANLQLRERLRNQSIRDPLTSLYNRRYTEETLKRELHRAQRSGHRLAVLAMDVDHFKKFNDTFGHQAGDQVLRDVAAQLIGSTRGGDIASRMGGEELLVMLAGADLHGAVEKAERMRDAVASLDVKHEGVSLGAVTMSIGVAVFPEHGGGYEELLRAADLALYRAKREGRNRVVVAEPRVTATSAK